MATVITATTTINEPSRVARTGATPVQRANCALAGCRIARKHQPGCDPRSRRTRASRRGRHRVSTDSKSIVQTGVPDCVLHNKNPLCPVNR